MKKIIPVILCLLVILGIPVSAQAAGTTAVKSNQPIFIDGWSWRMTTYNIDGNNYVRLRDVAESLGFDVTYNATDGSIQISTTTPYSGGAAAMGETPESAEVTETRLTVYVDGREQPLTAYNIGGNNYTKLRDVGAAVNFSVEWDAERNRVLIDASKPYTPEAAESDVPDTPNEPPAAADIPGGTVVDYSLEANPAIFDNYYTRAKYNQDRQRVLETGTTVVDWGAKNLPQSAAAIEAANRFIDSLAPLSAREKVYSINDFLCAHLTYKSGVTFSGDDFWTGMAYGVCAEYALMFQYMCYRAGIPSFTVKGTADGNGHGWNEVYFEGEWQFYDGNLSYIRQTAALGEAAKKGHIYTDGSPASTIYRRELYVPGSTK